jgi:predicted 2-oxoglutarate/Fe(II)-dependent dioxygenase YbiX
MENRAGAEPNPEYNELGYIREGLDTPEKQARYCAEQPPGLVATRGLVPPGILIIKKYLDSAACEFIVDYANRQAGEKSTVLSVGESTAGEVFARESTARTTEYVDIAGISDHVNSMMKDIFLREVQPFYSTEIEWFEYPEILRYHEGGHYQTHSDADNWVADDGKWSRGMDRDFSLLLYLNNDFSGGELDFPHFGFRIRPEAGMLVCFPSDHRYLHAAQPTLSGTRYALVGWAAAKGTPRVNEQPPKRSVRLSV